MALTDERYFSVLAHTERHSNDGKVIVYTCSITGVDVYLGAVRLRSHVR